MVTSLNVSYKEASTSGGSQVSVQGHPALIVGIHEGKVIAIDDSSPYRNPSSAIHTKSDIFNKLCRLGSAMLEQGCFWQDTASSVFSSPARLKPAGGSGARPKSRN